MIEASEPTLSNDPMLLTPITATNFAGSSNDIPNASATPAYVSFPSVMFSPLSSAGFSRSAFFQPLFASCSAYGQRRVGQRQRRRARHAARHVRHAVVDDAVDDVRRVLVRRRMDRLDAAALIDRHVHDHRARLHGLQVLAADELRRLGAGNQHRRQRRGRPSRSARGCCGGSSRSARTFAGITSDR